ncbi:unnamed protein product [Aphanomyces euteiches]|uniref:DUF4442 domain-containing protein n=1 Tax=Aphanomyces euteiches TaxID=100861 RepID=A0A6G0X393_9STRA|nr:hypothetical protein Ae201684_009120 [Aphanomyces euteiches]KAH9073715.1 hypothetical protein Ae201684P_003218 [Aphanomyces euteiches]KAH9146680.1 hypothetical protein AeRB84_009461 [Aphanomyces euteiches]
MAKPANKIAALVAKINSSGLPPSVRSAILTTAYNVQVKFAAFSGVRIESANESQAVLHLKNRFRVRNHIGSIHACSIGLLAESACGTVMGLNVRDSHLLLLKSMNMKCVKRTQGDVKAVATLTREQQEAIQNEDRGSVDISVVVTDGAGQEPVECTVSFAWVPRKRKA